MRELKNHLGRYLERVAQGEAFVVTHRGRPVARLVPLDAANRRLTELIAAGVVTPTTSSVRQLPARRIEASGSVSELVTDQRR